MKRIAPTFAPMPRRALTLVVAWALLIVVAPGCTATVRETLACQHCFCAWETRSPSHPVSCTAIDREIVCCVADSS